MGLPPQKRVSVKIRPREASDKITMIRRFGQGEKVTVLCREFKVSRTIFYRWLKRYNKTPLGEQLAALGSLRPKGEDHWRHVAGSRETVLEIIAKNPHLSAKKISKNLAYIYGRQILGTHGVHNLLVRENLNTFARRIKYAQRYQAEIRGQTAPLYEPQIPIYRLRQILAPFVTIPKLLLTKPLLGLTSIFFSILPLFVFYFWIKLLLSANQFSSFVGMFFASLSLTFGVLFFLYSLKYYFSMLMVLKLAQTGGNLSKKSTSPLLINLNNVLLNTKPFVSIHVAIYNEKKVIERLLSAISALDWPASTNSSSLGGPNFEVILVDDSTDGTTEIVKSYLKNSGEIKYSNNNTDGEILTVLTKNNYRFTLIHRNSRFGFKGGALQSALEQTDPAVEYVVVFDADFVPYPDTIEQFMKAFQALTVGSGESVVGSQNVASTNYKLQTTNSASRIAAVQGYQWHVLNKSQTWVTRGVRTEYAGSYVIERSSEEIYGGLKQIAGSVYAIRADVLRQFGWGKSLTEDFELTLRLYEAGYKVSFIPYIQAPAEAVSTIKRLIRQRMRWAEGASFNIKVMLGRMLFGRWQEQKDVIARNEVTKQSSSEIATGSSNLRNDDQGRIWVKSRLTTAEKLEFIYLAPYYLQAAFFVVGTLSWFISEAVLHSPLPFWTSAFGWSLVFTNLLSLPLMNIIGLFLEESDERDYLGVFSFIALSYIVVPFQAYAAIKGFIEPQEGPWFRTPKTGVITDVFSRSQFAKFFGNIFGKPQAVGSLSYAASDAAVVRSSLPTTNYQLPTNLAFSSALRPLQGSNFGIKPRHIRWVGNVTLSAVIALSVLMTIAAPFIPQATSYASQPALKTVANSQQEIGNQKQETDPKNSVDKEEILKNAQIQEITTPRMIQTTTKEGQTVEFIFHQEPRVRIKTQGKELEFETKKIAGIRANPAKSLIFADKEVTYQNIIDSVDLKYTITDGLLVEEFILNKPLIIAEIEQSLKTTELDISNPAPQVFGFTTADGKEIFKFTQPFAQDANGQRTPDIKINIEKQTIGYKLVKTVGQDAQRWLADPATAYPVSIDPSVVVSGTIAETEAQFGGLQRKVVYVSSNWYAFYTDGTDVFYKKSSNGSSWGDAVDIDTTDADNLNPSVWLEGTDIYVAWVDDGGDDIEVNKIDTASSDTLGTKCTSAVTQTIGSTFTVSITVADSGTIYLAYTDTSTDTEAVVLRLIFSGCTFTNITTGSGLTAGDRPVLVTVGNTINLIFQDGDLSHSAADNNGSWPITNVTVASVTDNFYDVTTDGTSLWVLTVSGTTATNFYKINPPIFYDYDTAAGLKTSAIYCLATDDCKVVYSGSSTNLSFVDCNNADCSSNSISSLATTAINEQDADLYCPTSTDCKVLYSDGGNHKFVDCNDTDCDTPDATTTIEADNSKQAANSIYCPANDATDCKLFYYNNASGDVTFVDCANASCSSPSLVDIDTNAGSQDDFAKAEDPNVAIDCPSATDCKLLYADSGTDVSSTTDITFVDCSAADCSTQDTGSPVGIDTDIDAIGDQEKRSVDIYCPAAGDCKLAYQDDNLGDLFFVDCDAANCSSSTISTIDSDVGTTFQDGVSIYCPAADDCKIAYHDQTDNDLTFVDCDSGTCGSPTIVDLDTDIASAELGVPGIYCISATDCKISYLDPADVDATFVDCNDAACYAISSLTAPFSGATNLTSATISYDSANSDLYAMVIQDTSEQAYWNSTDAGSISWTGGTTGTSFGFTAGDLGHISAPMTGTGTTDIGVVLRQDTNLEFSAVPEKVLLLILGLPLLPKILKRIRRRKQFNNLTI